MRDFKLKIAGYIIGFESSADGPELTVSNKFSQFVTSGSGYDCIVRIHSSPFDLPTEAERVFHAPYVEEKEGKLVQMNPDFWSIWKFNSQLFVKTNFPLSSEYKSAFLQFSLTGKVWDLWIESNDNEIDPFEYPLDGLVLYYLTVINNDIMIHASGVNNAGAGYLFTGVSGKGKSTMAHIWENYGARVIHDDRLIIRKTGTGYRMFNTPVYDNDSPLDSPLNKLFILEHGIGNKSTPLKESAAVSQIMANCIQHTWGTGIIGQLMESVAGMCGVIPVCRLSFSPSGSVIKHILNKDATN